MVPGGAGRRARLARPGPLHLPRRHRPGRLAAAVGLDLATSAGPAWTRLPDGQWYCHLFAPEQPDLNWDNREVRDDFLRTLRFWADRGVDGFRVDVAHALAKDLSEPLRSKTDAGPPDVPSTAPTRCTTATRCTRSTREWREVFNSYDPPRTAVAEAFAPSAARRALYARPTGLGQAFNFDLLQADFDAAAFREVVTDCLDQAAAGRLVLDLGAVQPRRGAARHPLRAARPAPTTPSG